MGCAVSDSREMVLPCATFFGNFGAVGASQRVLKLGLLLHYEVFYVLGGFIVRLV